MLGSLLRSFYRRSGMHCLSAKILLPNVALVLLFLLGAPIVYLQGSRFVQRRLLEQQVSADAARTVDALNQRVAALVDAGEALRSDPDALRALQEEAGGSSSVLRDRARAVHDRFNLSLVQVYNQDGLAEVDLVHPSVCLGASANSSILNLAETSKTVTRAVDDRLLLLRRVAVPNDAGTLVVGLDLATELHRIRSEDRLLTDVGLILRETRIGTDDALLFEDQEARPRDRLRRRQSILLGDTPVELLLVRSSEDIQRLTRVSVIVMIGSTLAATLSLSGMNAVTMRPLIQSLGALSTVAYGVAQGDLEREVRLGGNPLMIGEDDELALLVDSFSQMTARLRHCYADLRAKAQARTTDLTIAADVAGAVSSSLELRAVLQESSQIIERRLGKVCPGVHHVGVFLVEDDPELLVLTRVAGQEADDLSCRHVQVPVGCKSPVGLAAAWRRPEIVENAKAVSAHLKPPLLMDTYSAVAVPLLIGETLIGVLDVQSRQPGAFSPDTLPLLTTLANQIATGVRNARLYEQQCQAAQRLAEVDQLKTQLLAVVSHKFRAPLHTITALSNALLERVEDPLSHRQAHDISLISGLGRHLQELTDDFLDVSRMKAGTTTLNLETVDVRLLIESALDAIAPLIEDRPVSTSAEIDSALPVICADKRRLRHVMLHLLSSVATFTESGWISVRARRIEALNVETERVEPFVEVRIHTSGQGVSEGYAGDTPRALPRFGDLPSAGRGAQDFMLPVSQTLIDLHGGRMWTDARCSEEVTLTFVLPVAGPGAVNERLSERSEANGVETKSADIV